MTFNRILKGSLSVEKSIPAYCEICRKFTPTNQYSKVTNLPNILSINCGLANEKDLAFLKRQMYRNAAGTHSTNTSSNDNTSSGTNSTKPCRYGLHCSRIDCHFAHPEVRKSPIINTTSSTSVKSNMWFPLNFSMEIDENDELQITNSNTDIPPSPMKARNRNATSLSKDDEIDNLETEEERKLQIEMEDIMKVIDEGEQIMPNGETKVKKEYKLSAVICEINDGTQKNLVSLVNVPVGYHDMKLGGNEGGTGGWYIFNDFRFVNFIEQFFLKLIIKQFNLKHITGISSRSCMVHFGLESSMCAIL